MKDIIIGVLVVIIVINAIFISCCLKLNKEAEEFDEYEDRDE